MTDEADVSPTMQAMLLRLLQHGPATHPSPWGTVTALVRRGLVAHDRVQVALTARGRVVAQRIRATRAAATAAGVVPYTFHGVLAGAYAGKVPELDRTLVHVSTDGATAVCGRTSNLCDVEEPGPPTCARCCAWMRKHG